jgi:actin-like ATPase involved in cell morphogenesis
MAQKLLEKVASCTLNAGRQWLVAGQDTGNGSPKEVTLTSGMVSDAVQKWLAEQIRLLKLLL